MRQPHGLPNYDGGICLSKSGCRQDRCLRIGTPAEECIKPLPLGPSADTDTSGCWLQRHTGACGIRGQPELCDKVITEAVYLPRFLYEAGSSDPRFEDSFDMQGNLDPAFATDHARGPKSPSTRSHDIVYSQSQVMGTFHLIR